MMRILLIIALAVGWHSAAFAQLCQWERSGALCKRCTNAGIGHIKSGGFCTECVVSCTRIEPIAPGGAGQKNASACTPVVNEQMARQALFYKLTAATDELGQLAAVSPSAALAVNAFARHGEVIPAVDMRSGHLFAAGLPTSAQAKAVIARDTGEESDLAGLQNDQALKVEYTTQVLADARAVLTVTPWVIDAEGQHLYQADTAVAIELALIVGKTAVVDAVDREASVYRMTGYKMLD